MHNKKVRTQSHLPLQLCNAHLPHDGRVLPGLVRVFPRLAFPGLVVPPRGDTKSTSSSNSPYNAARMFTPIISSKTNVAPYSMSWVFACSPPPHPNRRALFTLRISHQLARPFPPRAPCRAPPPAAAPNRRLSSQGVCTDGLGSPNGTTHRREDRNRGAAGTKAARVGASR